jgi:hypothetical protein
MGKTPAWKAETLPPDFGDTLDDLTAHVTFMGGFKDRLRHQRDNFRVIVSAKPILDILCCTDKLFQSHSS